MGPAPWPATPLGVHLEGWAEGEGAHHHGGTGVPNRKDLPVGARARTKHNGIKPAAPIVGPSASNKVGER